MSDDTRDPTRDPDLTSSSASATTVTSSAPESNSIISSLTSSRSQKQFTLFLAGATFLTLSTLTTRRSLFRRYKLTQPSFFQASNAPIQFVNGPLEAFDALSIATMNVTSTMMMMTGGLLWAFDIGSIEDLRRKIRGGLGVDGTGRNARAVEEEFEEWMASTLERKRWKEGEGETEGTEGFEVQGTRKNERGKPR